MKKRIINIYYMISITFFNFILLFIVFNMLAMLFIAFSRSFSSLEDKYLTPPGVSKQDMMDSCYPGIGEKDLTAIKSAFLSLNMEYDEYVQFRIPAQSHFNILNVHTAGFRHSTDQAPWPPNQESVNVFFFGGSTLFGYWVPDSHTIPSFFRQELADVSGIPQVHVYNFGQPYFFSSQERVFFQRLLQEGHIPQIAIFFDGLNDINIGDELMFTPRLRRIFDQQKDGAVLWKNALAELPLIECGRILTSSFTQERKSRERLFGVEHSDKEFKKRVTKSLKRYLSNKVMIQSIAHAFGVKVLFVWQPVPFYNYDTRFHLFLYETDPSYSFKKFGYAYNLTRRLSNEGKVGSDFLWLADIQLGTKKPLYVDFVHYGATASQMIAEKVADHVIQNDMIR